MSVTIAAIRLVSADADRLAAFYERAFGFVREADIVGLSDPFSGEARRCLRLRLGRECIEIVQFDSAGAPVVPGAPDTLFQHFAIVTPSMSAAMRQLDGVAGWTPITQGGPQRLPQSSGGVAAFKFRDPEGHPLELLSFPADQAPEAWRAGSDEFLGIDHTAIVVRDTARSVAFYAPLGFRRQGGSSNAGNEQGLLDGVADPRVEVTALALPGAPPPHLELLCYKRPIAPGGHSDAGDIVATRTVLGGGDAAGMIDPAGHRWICAATAS